MPEIVYQECANMMNAGRDGGKDGLWLGAML
jgi:hypothetical protein